MTTTHNLNVFADLLNPEVIFIISGSKRQTTFLLLKMGVGLFNAPKIQCTPESVNDDRF